MAIIGFPLLSVQITKPFSRISNNFFFGSTDSFLNACFSGAFICFTEASSPSNINNEQFYLQFDFGVGCSEISLMRDVPACCVQPRRIIPLDGHIPCCHSFMSDSHVCVVFDILKKTQPRRSFLRYGSRQTKHIRAQCKSLKNFLYCGSYVPCHMVSVYRNLLR